MGSVKSDAPFDMTGLFGGYRLASESIERTGDTGVKWNLYYPGGFFPSMSVTLTGTGLTYGPDDAPTGGTVTSVTVHLDRYDPDNPNVSLTGLSLAMTDLLSDGFEAGLTATNLFGLALAGNDLLEIGSDGIAYGDLSHVSTALSVLGADRLVLTGTDGMLWGDAQVILPGADATGGSDVLIARGQSDFGLRMIGDAQGMTGGTFIGGADILRNAGGGTDFARDLLVGDVQEINGAAHLTGGNDRLTGAPSLGDVLVGDVQGLYADAATLVAGNDVLFGRGGADLLYGDVDQLQGGTLAPGNDRLFGGAGDDILFGDYARNSGGTVLDGGRDLLSGGSGNDALLGQGGNDTLRGGAGNDTLAGDAGRDLLKGGPGADLIQGGLGGDRMNGQGGADTFVFRSADETGTGTQRDVIFAFQSGLDQLDLSAVARASITGGLTWVGADYAKEAGTIGYTDAGTRLRVLANLDDDPAAEVVFWVKGTEGLTEADVLL